MFQSDGIERLLPIAQHISIESQEDMLESFTDHCIERFKLFHLDALTIGRVGNQHTSPLWGFGVLLQWQHAQVDIFFQPGASDVLLRDGDSHWRYIGANDTMGELTCTGIIIVYRTE